ncbi:hypothetical protein ABZS94_28600 [Streptomyces sp. NPDC005500]|uniref:hypothetical protein n=1 Tax=Streptomyces sp. NPDC005500 TaxID=3155007 RepID=UPI0033A56409
MRLLPRSDFDESDPRRAIGQIEIGEFSENFPMALSYWNGGEYRESWELAIRLLVEGEIETSCLVASIGEPTTANFISCWPLYRREEKVFVQNSLIFTNELDEPFDPNQPWLSVEPRTTVDEDGLRISEWETTVSDLREFLQNISRAPKSS